MAWSFVGVTNAAAVTATSITLTEPAGVANGDLLVACFASRTTATTAITNTGWTAVGSQNNNNTLTTGSAIASGTMLYQVRAGTPDLTFVIPAGISVALGSMVAYRGNAATTPLDASTAVTAAAGLTPSVTGLTTTQADDLVVAMCAGGQEAAWSSFNATTPSGASGATDTSTAPSATWRERADNVTTTGADTSLGIFDALKTAAGATGNLTATASVSAGHVIIAGAFKILPSAISVSASITGQAVTASVGTATSSIPVTAAVTGQEVAASVGTVTVDAIVAPFTGQRSYIVGGPLGVTYISETGDDSYATPAGYVTETYAPAGAVTVDVTGQEVAASVGTVTVSTAAAVSANVTGQQLTTSVGTVTVDAIVAPFTGQRSYIVGGPLGVTYVSETGDDSYATPAGYVTETYAPAGAVTVDVTGQELTTAVGTATVTTVASVTADVTGQALTAAVGTATATGKATATVTGQTITASVDSVTVTGKASASVSGQAVTASVGTVTATGKANATVTGQQVTASIGTATATGKATASVTGLQATAAVGTATVVGKATANVTGQELTTAVGTATATGKATASVTGQAVTAAVGSATVVGKATATLTGQEIASAVGSVAVTAIQKATADVTGQQITALVNGVSVTAGGSVSVSLTGQQLTASVGDVTVAAVAGTVGVWNGTNWVQKPAKVWTGSAWVQKPVKTWNGTSWAA